MAWLRLDDGFTRHPKFEGWTIPQRWAWLEVMEYCARYSTSGRIPTDLTLLPRSTTTQLLARAEVSKWCERGPDGALWINDFEVYNPPRETIDDAVLAYLEDHPDASGNEVCREVTGSRKRILAAVARFRSGSLTGSETGTEVVLNRDASGYARGGAGTRASPSRPPLSSSNGAVDADEADREWPDEPDTGDGANSPGISLDQITPDLKSIP